MSPLLHRRVGQRYWRFKKADDEAIVELAKTDGAGTQREKLRRRNGGAEAESDISRIADALDDLPVDRAMRMNGMIENADEARVTTSFNPRAK
jgi:hypothetical protein